MGSMLAFASPIKGTVTREVASFSGLMLILCSYFLWPEGVSFPGVSAIPPIIGTMLFIWGGVGQRVLPTVNRALAFKPFVGIGLISYSLYLWHWPIIAYIEYLGYSIDGLGAMFFLILIIFLVSWFSWRFVEMPFRGMKCSSGNGKTILIGAVVGFIGLIFGFVAWKTKGVVFRDLSDVRKVRLTNSGISFMDADDLGLGDPDVTTGRLGLWNGGDSVDFIIWGDSHATVLAEGFDQVALQSGRRGLLYATHSRLPLLGVKVVGYSDLSQRAVDVILSYQPRCVFLTGYWYRLLSGRSEHRRNAIVVGDGLDCSDGARIQAVRDGLDATIRVFLESDISVVIISDVPDQKINAGRVYLSSLALNSLPLRKSFDVGQVGITIGEHLSDQGVVNGLFEDVSRQYENVHFVDTTPLFFSSGVSSIGDSYGSFYRDNNHLNDYGVTVLMKESISGWLKLGLTQGGRLE